jgi:hypothetical protein
MFGTIELTFRHGVLLKSLRYLSIFYNRHRATIWFRFWIFGKIGNLLIRANSILVFSNFDHLIAGLIIDNSGSILTIWNQL